MELLERLEISIINYKEVLEVETNRLDSDYYKKRYIKLLKKIESQKSNFKQFIDLKLKVDASAFYPSLEPYYNTGDFPFLRVADVNTNIDYEGCIRVPKEIIEADNFNTLKIIDEGDIIITKGGSIARVGLIEQKTAVTRDLIFVNSSTLSKIDYKFLFLYLMSNVSYDLLIRSSSMTAQPHLTIKLVRDLPLFTASNHFKIEVAKIFDISKEKLIASKFLYTQAETLLLQEIGFNESLLPSKQEVSGSNPDWITNSTVAKTGVEPNVNVKSFKESFGVTGRLDAEYYQKKYEAVVEKIKSQNHDTLKSIVEINKSIEPGSNYYSDDETGLPFMRVADYNKFGLSEPNKKLTSDFVKDNQDKIDELKPKKGTILFSKDGSVGTAYHLREDLEGVTSSAILHLKVKNEKEVIPEYLTLALNSKLVQMQAERDAGGSIILHWRVGEIQNVVVPIIDYTKQQEIAQLIEESFSLKKESEHLLEIAKKAVEMAIEENEEVAIAFIKANTK